MLTQRRDCDVGQSDVPSASAGLGCLNANAVRLGILKSLAHIQGLLIEIDVVMPQGKHFAEPQTGDQC